LKWFVHQSKLGCKAGRFKEQVELSDVELPRCHLYLGPFCEKLSQQAWETNKKKERNIKNHSGKSIK
jgi:hypothetical protein